VNQTTTIYVLKDARGGVRYVGKSSHSVTKRLSRHMADARDGYKTHKATWIRSMLRIGKIPSIETIEIVDGNGCNAERKWIAFFKNNGVDLTNATEGGEGIVGYKQSAETKRKHSEGIKKFYQTHRRYNYGKPPSLETRAKIGLAHKGTRRSEESKKRMSEARKGIVFSAEHLKNLSESHSGSKHQNYGKRLTDELKKKISESIKIAWTESRLHIPARATTGQWQKTA